MRFPGNAAYAGDVAYLPRVNVYSPGGASWYGPGFYGNRTACGQTLTARSRASPTATLPVRHEGPPLLPRAGP